MKNKVLSAIIATLMTASFALTGCGKTENGSLNVNETPAGDDTITVERPIEAPSDLIADAVRPGEKYALSRTMSFLSSDLGVSTLSDDEYISVELTATVLPEDASDKSVDWLVEWATGATLQNEKVTNYVTVVPTTDGSTKATVTCKKAFINNVIVITVKTRDGGYEDYCNVSFVGVPENIKINNGAAGEMEFEETCNFAIELTNRYGVVGQQYIDAMGVSGVAVIGTYKGDGRYTNESGYSWEGNETVCKIEDLKVFGDGTSVQALTIEQLLTATVFESTLTVRSLRTLTDCAQSYRNVGGIPYMANCVKSDVDMYAKILVGWGQYGDYQSEFTIHFTTGVSSVTLSSAALEF